MLQNIKKPHFIGIGGVGMSAIAHVLNKQGMQVSGSDAAQTSITEKLATDGVSICIGHAGENLPADCDAVVISSAIRQENPEIIEACKRNLPVYHRSDMLAELMNDKLGVAVAGAHGKTTTTSMLSCVAVEAGIDPSYLIGGEVAALGGNAHFGSSDWLIAEADESDGSFLKFFPHLSIITNIENDHLDHYKSVTQIKEAFLQFARQTSPTGAVILCFEDENLIEMAGQLKTRVLSYAIDKEADYQAKNIEFGKNGSIYDVYFKGQFIIQIKLAVPGRHNILNSLAVFAAADILGITAEKIAVCLSDFTGAKRRFEKKAEIQDVLIVDDYAHHPSEIKSTLMAAKQLKKKRIIAVFQPHRYTRTQFLCEEFGSSFAFCDLLVLTEVYAAGELPIEGISGQTLVDEVKKQGRKDVVFLPSPQDVADYLAGIVQADDLVLTLGAGDIYKAGELLAKKLLAKGDNI